MVKVFTLNKNNKIEFTEKELQKLLDEMYYEGYRNGLNRHYYYYPPNRPWPDVWYSSTSGGCDSSMTISNMEAKYEYPSMSSTCKCKGDK